MKILSQMTIALMAITLSGSQAFAAGFEKSLTWSPKAAAQAGAVVGDVSGADALYFNPAGLTTGAASGGNVSLNFSPTFSQFEGQQATSNSAPYGKGKSGFSPVFGATAAYQVNEKLGVGLGYYVSGGTKSKYENLDMNSSTATFDYNDLKPTVETDLAITELALGAGYEVAPGFKIGAAWRALFVKAKFSSMTRNTTNTALSNVTIDNLEATRWNAFKLGAQYTASDKSWGLGANFRSAVKFNAEGDGTGNAELSTAAGGTNLTLGTGKIHAANEFPLQIAIGGFTKATDTLKVALEYSFTNYSKNKVLDLSGSLTGGTAGTQNLSNSDIAQNWKNQHIGRAGFEYTGMSMPIRFGYAYTSQVTASNRARSTFASPGSGHAIAAGTGLKFMEDKMEANFAGEYSFASGKGTNPNDAITEEKEFKSHAYVIHTGVSYNF